MELKKSNGILVAGAGGFIGGHLIQRLLQEGVTNIRAVDIKPAEEWYQWHESVDNRILDLRESQPCHQATDGMDMVFQLACDMGGIGFIETHKAVCMRNVLINTHMIDAAVRHGVQRYFYSSSACVYNTELQIGNGITALKESDAHPASPEGGYGWEKLFSEKLSENYYLDTGLETRVARYHNAYGPYGSFQDGREKAPAALCRKIAMAKRSGLHKIDIWGDGQQTRSFMYIDDCIEGTLKITQSECHVPLNLGSSELVTINQLADIIEDIAGIQVKREYNLDAPVGVQGRNSDNTMIQQELGWSPSISLQEGLETTYKWIYDALSK